MPGSGFRRPIRGTRQRELPKFGFSGTMNRSDRQNALITMDETTITPVPPLDTPDGIPFDGYRLSRSGRVLLAVWGVFLVAGFSVAMTLRTGSARIRHPSESRTSSLQFSRLVRYWLSQLRQHDLFRPFRPRQLDSRDEFQSGSLLPGTRQRRDGALECFQRLAGTALENQSTGHRVHVDAADPMRNLARPVAGQTRVELKHLAIR